MGRLGFTDHLGKTPKFTEVHSEWYSGVLLASLVLQNVQLLKTLIDFNGFLKAKKITCDNIFKAIVHRH